LTGIPPRVDFQLPLDVPLLTLSRKARLCCLANRFEPAAEVSPPSSASLLPPSPPSLPPSSPPLKTARKCPVTNGIRMNPSSSRSPYHLRHRRLNRWIYPTQSLQQQH
jgi:hypothetical protein